MYCFYVYIYIDIPIVFMKKVYNPVDMLRLG